MTEELFIEKLSGFYKRDFISAAYSYVSDIINSFSYTPGVSTQIKYKLKCMAIRFYYRHALPQEPQDMSSLNDWITMHTFGRLCALAVIKIECWQKTGDWFD